MSKILFDDGSSAWPYNAVLNYDKDMGERAYPLGYKQAADALIDLVGERKVTTDVVVYPICFLYRHYVELSIKFVIARYARAYGMGKYKQYMLHPNHSIDKLWAKMLAMLNERSETAMPPHETHDIIAEISSIDPQGIAFRYYAELDGRRALRDQHGKVPNELALDCLKEKMEQVDDFFYGFDMVLEQRTEYYI